MDIYNMADHDLGGGDAFGQACGYIGEHGQYFGRTILEVGCGSGYMTGFLAKTFPDAKITAIDRNEAALKTAEKRLSDIDADNVELRCCALSDVEESFDTIVCMGALRENCDEKDLPHEGEPLLYQFAVFKAVTREFTRLLADHLVDAGTLCVFERIGHDPLLCGWLLELENHSCGILPDTYREISFEESGVTNTFQAFVSRKGSRNTVKQILDLWYEPVNQYHSGMTALTGWKALDYLNRNAGALVRGVRVYDDKTGHQVGRFALFKDCDSDQVIYLLVSTGSADDVILQSHDWGLEREILDRMQEIIDTNAGKGLRYEEIGPDDRIVEGRIKVGFVKKY